MGRCNCGSGSVGPEGPVGPTGPAGPTGAAGPAGATGLGVGGYYPDAVPVSPNANDDEFDDNSIGGAWAEWDPGSCVTLAEDDRGLSIVHSAVTALGGIYRDLPAGDFSIVIKPTLTCATAAVKQIGLVWMQDATDSGGDVEGPFIQYNAATSSAKHETWSAYNFETGDLGQTMDDIQPRYLRIRKAGSTYSSDFSLDGVGWFNINSGALAMSGTPLHVGVAMRADSGGATGHVRFWRQSAVTDLDQLLLGRTL